MTIEKIIEGYQREQVILAHRLGNIRNCNETIGQSWNIKERLNKIDEAILEIVKANLSTLEKDPTN